MVEDFIENDDRKYHGPCVLNPSTIEQSELQHRLARQNPPDIPRASHDEVGSPRRPFQVILEAIEEAPSPRLERQHLSRAVRTGPRVGREEEAGDAREREPSSSSITCFCPSVAATPSPLSGLGVLPAAAAISFCDSSSLVRKQEPCVVEEGCHQNGKVQCCTQTRSPGCVERSVHASRPQPSTLSPYGSRFDELQEHLGRILDMHPGVNIGPTAEMERRRVL